MVFILSFIQKAVHTQLASIAERRLPVPERRVRVCRRVAAFSPQPNTIFDELIITMRIKRLESGWRDTAASAPNLLRLQSLEARAAHTNRIRLHK